MEKIIIIPDVHGRTFWKEAVYKYRNVEGVHIVFLGDYLDAYKDIDGIEPEDAIVNFEEIIDVARSANNITLLIGNHDLHYWPIYLKSWGCRRYELYKNDISNMFLSNKDLFKIAYETYINGKQYLFTHAGVVKLWYEWITGKLYRGTEYDKYYYKDVYELSDEDAKLLDIELNAEGLNSLLGHKQGQIVLGMVSRDRGGDEINGSCLWADIHEHLWAWEKFDNNKLYQIFSHSFVYPSFDEYFIDENIAMLDCRKTFVLDCKTGIITEYKE